MTEAFRAKAGTTEVHTVNRLIVQGRMELEETLMMVRIPSSRDVWLLPAPALPLHG